MARAFSAAICEERCAFGRLDLIVLAAVAAVSCGGQSQADPGDKDDAGSAPVQDAAPELEPAYSGPARGVSITRVALYQGVEVTLVENGAAPVAPQSPIVHGRDAMLRVFVDVESGFIAREFRARLDLGNGPPLEVVQRIAGDSDPFRLTSTINFMLPGELVASEVRWSVAIEESRPTRSAKGSSEGSRFPRDGFTSFTSETPGESLRVMLVPFRYDADGSARVPDTGIATVEDYRDRLLGMFPVPSIEISVHEPAPLAFRIAPSGDGWEQLLQTVLELRQADGAPQNAYYYALVDPAEAWQKYCFSEDGSGCIFGLAPLAEANQEWARGGAGVGFGNSGIDTMAHELGHALGRNHAPCRTPTFDPAFPYSDGKIGVRGYDTVRRTLHEPDSTFDLMGYCDPRWVSDYTFRGLFERIGYVNSLASFGDAPARPRRYRFVSVDAQGVGTLGRTVTLQAPPLGEQRSVPVRSSTSTSRSPGTVSGTFVPYGDLPGGLLVAPI